MKNQKFLVITLISCLAWVAQNTTAAVQDVARIVFTNVHVFDGVGEKRIENANVLVEGNSIKSISTKPITADGATVNGLQSKVKVAGAY